MKDERPLLLSYWLYLIKEKGFKNIDVNITFRMFLYCAVSNYFSEKSFCTLKGHKINYSKKIFNELLNNFVIQNQTSTKIKKKTISLVIVVIKKFEQMFERIVRFIDISMQ